MKVVEFHQMFAVGDLVVLKSGGPIMVVSGFNNKFIDVDWFVQDDVKRAEFRPEQLIVIAKRGTDHADQEKA